MPIFTTRDSHRLHFKFEEQESKNTPLLFLNGMTQTTRHWASHVREFRDDRSVLTYDARGQGESDNPKGVPTLEDHVEDLRELLDHLDIKALDLVGFSHGARVALGFAIAYPERVKKLVLCSATAEPTALARTIIRSWQEVLKTGGLAALSWASLTNILGTTFLQQNERLLRNIVQASVERNDPEGVRLLLEGLANFPPLDDLAGKVTAPTLVLSATEDPLATPSGARKLAELCQGKHVLISDSGHTIPIERPKRFREELLKFL